MSFIAAGCYIIFKIICRMIFHVMNAVVEKFPNIQPQDETIASRRIKMNVDAMKRKNTAIRTNIYWCAHIFFKTIHIQFCHMEMKRHIYLISSFKVKLEMKSTK